MIHVETNLDHLPNKFSKRPKSRLGILQRTGQPLACLQPFAAQIFIYIHGGSEKMPRKKLISLGSPRRTIIH